MRRPLMFVAAILAGLLVAGCGGDGNPADPPAGVTAVAGDGIITVSWPMAADVEYWLFIGQATSISTANWTNIPGSRVIMGTASPLLIPGLTNGAIYSVTINGRTNGGPGGDGTPSVSAIPRLAGTASATLPAPWVPGTALGASDLRGLTFGTNKYVAAGAGGAMYSSTDGAAWTALTSGVATNLNSATYRGVYLAAGDGGAMLYSIDGTTWTPRTTGTVNDLYAVATSSGQFVAVGAKGTIIYSADGVTWTAAANSATTNDLYAVINYGNSTWIAVGANGTLIKSADGSTWTAVTSNTASDLKGVTFGTNVTTGATVFAAVGAGGTYVTSPDTVTWTVQPAIGSSTLAAIMYGTQFVAAGAGGKIYTSTDGATWASQPSTTTSNLNAIYRAQYNYAVVGAAGTNLLAK